MIHFIKSLLFFIILIVCSVSAFGQDQASLWSQVRKASPVFEDMLANQVVSVRRELIKDKPIQKENPIYVVAQAGEEKMFDRIVASLNKIEPSVPWNALFFVTPEFSKAASLVNEAKEGSFVIVLVFQSERSQWESTAEQSGLSLSDSMSVPELEFAKDEAGRQVINLDEPQYEYQIYERLVREGMNPVYAHSEASQVVKKLRQMNHIQVLFFSKKPSKSAENP